MAQQEKFRDQARAKTDTSLLIKEHWLSVILSFLTLFFLCLSMSAQQARANPFISASTPGMVMAKIEFEFNSPGDDRLLSPKQMRFEVLNSGGEELMYVKSSIDNFNLQAGFAHSKKDKYKRPDDYPRSREGFIAEKPKTYEEALARYSRAIYLLKASNSLNAKARARAHMMHCHQQAQEFYKKEMAALKRAN